MTKEELVELVNREDFLEYIQSLSKEEVKDLLGENFYRMVGYDQNNIHHCYDLYNHIIHTVDNVDKEGLSPDEITNLKIAALYHDVGKPDVVIQKNGKSSFPGHAKKSKEIASKELSNVGFSPEEVDKINFLIAHHDDFIAYKNEIPGYMSNHMYVRKISPNSIVEKMIENEYDFEAMGLSKEQIRYTCKYLANKYDDTVQDKEVTFTSPNGKVEVEVDMEDVMMKMSSGKYPSEYHANKRDHELLLNLCRADANAQTKYYEENGRVLCSRKDKLSNYDSIEGFLDNSYGIFEKFNDDIEMNKKLLSEIYINEDKTKDINSAKELYDSYSELDLNNKEK